MVAEKSYKWVLRRSSKKEICPRCGQRRFVPYVAKADGKTMAGAEYGRCDRQDHCAYHLYPNKVSDEDITPIARKAEPPLRFYPASIRVDTRTPLFQYACKAIGVSRALDVWERYKVGRDGVRTVFWQIAKDGTIRAGKSIPYKDDGHRDKTDKMPANWLHCSKAWDGYRTGRELQQCYFGEHLLNDSPEAKVVIVESEKTAMLMSAISDGWVWLASGGAQGLSNEQKNKALDGREVWLLPDNGQYWKWRAIADKNGWHIFNQLETNPIFEGCDILDLFDAGVLGKIKMRNENQ